MIDNTLILRFRCHNNWRWGELQPGAASAVLSGTCICAEEQYSDYGRGHCFHRHGYGVCVCVFRIRIKSRRGRREKPQGPRPRFLSHSQAPFSSTAPLPSSLQNKWSVAVLNALAGLIEERTHTEGQFDRFKMKGKRPCEKYWCFCTTYRLM